MNNRLKPWDGTVLDRLVVVLSCSGPKSPALSLYFPPTPNKDLDDCLVSMMGGSIRHAGRELSAAMVKVHHVPCYVNGGVWLHGKRAFNLKAMAMYGEVLEVVNDTGVLGTCDGLLQPGEVIPLAVIVQRAEGKYRLINTSMYYDCSLVGRLVYLTSDDKRSRIALRRHMLGFDPTIAVMLNKDPMADIDALDDRISDAWSKRMADLKSSIRSKYR